LRGKFRLELRVDPIPIEIWPSELDIAAQRAAVLQLLGQPMRFEPLGDLVVGGEIIDQVPGIEISRRLDEGGGGDQLEDRLVAGDRIAPQCRPVDAVERPARLRRDGGSDRAG
jgi:hypothetical protein